MEIKIGEIAKRSGVPPSTIRYYVRQGLLPEPTKVNKSMAYYDERCVERIQTIRYLQETKYFPLSVIRNILRRMDKGLSLEEAEAIEDAVFGVSSEADNVMVEKSKFLEQTGLTDEQLQLAQKTGLLMPYMQEKGKVLYDQEDIRFARDILKRIMDYGLDIRKLDFYVRLGNEIIDHELRLRRDAVHGTSAKENIRITTEISRVAEFLRGYILKRLFQRRIQSTIQKSLQK
ncbi:MAG: MerR family transcriptional regulator [Pseudomonadota bacterium]|jgi:DNA-binding transcriptional MerR regulator|nr:MerR family transcriptional regulator [Pseudomonadota bacterium]HON38620.1 MerR family transcriptional regulator [Deltaproteobacteria bacterium]HRS55363.1 MerR family transcriptional regulator [Desulfomonilia bacterium]HPD21754.1 MerR family transcriptional regulator [Deltaproteobacteria bacterium]HPW70107.1 MerR family transcriptional regulator [Deltaproteobacteria bacterium]